jgi:hypothetical protein
MTLSPENAALVERLRAMDVRASRSHNCANAADRIESLAARCAALMAALKEIAESPHCAYDFNKNPNQSGEYNTGVVDGHRCAAAIARAAISADSTAWLEGERQKARAARDEEYRIAFGLKYADGSPMLLEWMTPDLCKSILELMREPSGDSR